MILAFLGIDSFVDFCGVAGLFVSIVGLTAAWREARAAKSAAEQAKEAATQMRHDLNQFDIVKTLSEALSTFDEVKTLQRYGVWELLPNSYTEIKKALLSVKHTAPKLTSVHKKRLQSAIQTCASIEDEIETSLSLKQNPVDVARLNRSLSTHVMDLQEVLLHVRAQVGRSDHG